MDQELQNLIQLVCSSFTTYDVKVIHIFDLRRFARMAHYAWKHDIGFHREMFKKALKETELFGNLTDEELDEKSLDLCLQAEFAKGILHAAFDFGENN